MSDDDKNKAKLVGHLNEKCELWVAETRADMKLHADAVGRGRVWWMGEDAVCERHRRFGKSKSSAKFRYCLPSQFEAIKTWPEFTPIAEELPGGARLVGKVVERDVYLCDDLTVASRAWPRAKRAIFALHHTSSEPGPHPSDILVCVKSLSQIKEQWGFVPLAEPEGRPEYEGLERVGKFDGVQVYVGERDHFHSLPLTEVEWDWSFVPGNWKDAYGWPRQSSNPDKSKSLCISPECLAAMLTWAREWDDLPGDGLHHGVGLCPCRPPGERGGVTAALPCILCGLRLAGKPSETAEPEHTCQEPQKGCEVHVPPEDCEACQREDDDHTCGEAVPGHGGARGPENCEACQREADEPTADEIRSTSPGTPAPAIDLSGRHTVWGDMKTDRAEKSGPILVCGKPGHVRLMLKQLSDDHGRAMLQLALAATECEMKKWKGALGERLKTLSSKLDSTREAIEVGWEPEPYLQAVRDAHEAIGIEREWQAGKVRPCAGFERINNQDPWPWQTVAEATPKWRD